MDDEKFMRDAIKDAKQNDHRFGAVIAKDGEVIATSGKRPKSDPRYHAETQAIFNAGEKLGKNLENCVLYTTCEPCIMCFYMAWVTGIRKIFFGATIKDSIEAGLPEVDISARELNEKSGNLVELRDNFLRDECLSLLREDHKRLGP